MRKSLARIPKQDPSAQAWVSRVLPRQNSSFSVLRVSLKSTVGLCLKELFRERFREWAELELLRKIVFPRGGRGSKGRLYGQWRQMEAESKCRERRHTGQVQSRDMEATAQPGAPKDTRAETSAGAETLAGASQYAGFLLFYKKKPLVWGGEELWSPVAQDGPM